jgi:hypothetical protein
MPATAAAAAPVAWPARSRVAHRGRRDSSRGRPRRCWASTRAKAKGRRPRRSTRPRAATRRPTASASSRAVTLMPSQRPSRRPPVKPRVWPAATPPPRRGPTSGSSPTRLRSLRALWRRCGRWTPTPSPAGTCSAAAWATSRSARLRSASTCCARCRARRRCAAAGGGRRPGPPAQAVYTGRARLPARGRRLRGAPVRAAVAGLGHPCGGDGAWEDANRRTHPYLAVGDPVSLQLRAAPQLSSIKERQEDQWGRDHASGIHCTGGRRALCVPPGQLAPWRAAPCPDSCTRPRRSRPMQSCP